MSIFFFFLLITCGGTFLILFCYIIKSHPYTLYNSNLTLKFDFYDNKMTDHIYIYICVLTSYRVLFNIKYYLKMFNFRNIYKCWNNF